MTRRGLFKLAFAIPSITVAGAILSVMGKPKEIPRVKRGDILTSERMNEIIDRLNQLQ